MLKKYNFIGLFGIVFLRLCDVIPGYACLVCVVMHYSD